MALFRTGEIVTTNGIARAMMLDHRFLEAVRGCLARHCLGEGTPAMRPKAERRGAGNREELEADRLPVQRLRHRREGVLHHHGDRQVGDDHPVPRRILKKRSEEKPPTINHHSDRIQLKLDSLISFLNKSILKTQ